MAKALARKAEAQNLRPGSEVSGRAPWEILRVRRTQAKSLDLGLI